MTKTMKGASLLMAALLLGGAFVAATPAAQADDDWRSGGRWNNGQNWNGNTGWNPNGGGPWQNGSGKNKFKKYKKFKANNGMRGNRIQQLLNSGKLNGADQDFIADLVDRKNSGNFSISNAERQRLASILRGVRRGNNWNNGNWNGGGSWNSNNWNNAGYDPNLDPYYNQNNPGILSALGNGLLGNGALGSGAFGSGAFGSGAFGSGALGNGAFDPNLGYDPSLYQGYDPSLYNSGGFMDNLRNALSGMGIAF